MLFSHHFNSPLRTIQIKFIVLFFILSILLSLMVSRSLLSLISIAFAHGFWTRQNDVSMFILPWSSVALTDSFVFSDCKIINIRNTILHQNKMGILVWTLLSLSLFNFPVKTIDSFFVLVFQLGLNTFILYILEPVHLKLSISLILSLRLSTKIPSGLVELFCN